MGGGTAFGHVLLISCHGDSKAVGAPRQEAVGFKSLQQRFSWAIMPLPWQPMDQLAEEIYNYYKPDTGVLSAAIST